MPLPVAVNGTVSLQGPTRQGDAPQPLTKRAMIIRMSEETLEALAAYPAHPPLQFEFGDTPVRVYTIHYYSFLCFNSCTLPSQPPGYSHRVYFLPNARGSRVHPHELYLRSALASKINAPLKLYADIAGKFNVERELNGKAESKVHQSTADAQKTKSERRIVLLDNPPTLTSSATKTKPSAPAKKRKPAVSATTTVRRVQHIIQAKYEGSSVARGRQSPSHPLPSSQASPVSPAIRAQMVHLLAKGPRTKEDVLTQVGGSDASESLRVQLNELLVTIAERERPNSKSAVPGQPLYTLLPISWKEVRPYEFAGLTDDERRKMWRQARQSLYSLGIPESDAAWDHVRTLPGSAVTSSSKVGAGPKRATGAVGTERKKNAGSTSKAPVEAKIEGVRPSQTAKVREEVTQFPRPTKTAPKREKDETASRRLPGMSGPRNSRDTAPSQSSSQSQSQAQGPTKKAGLTDSRGSRGDSSKPNGRAGLATPIQPSSSHEREPEREGTARVMKKLRESGSDLDRDKGKSVPAPKMKRRKDDASDLESSRDWDGTDTLGKANTKRKKLREDHDDKDSINGAGNAVKRRKVVDDDRPYKPGGGGGGGGGTSKARERDRDKESDRRQGKARDRDLLPIAKRPRDNDLGSPDASPPPRKSTVHERERQREREPDRSVSPPRRVKREPSLSPALHNSRQRESSPIPRVSTKHTGSPPREAVKREDSPRPHGHSRRGDSPPAPRTSKRATSPLRSQAHVRDRDRDRESSANGVSTTRRRRSPIYTSSEDEHHNAPVRRNAPSSVTSSSSSREAVRTQGYASHPSPPTTPYPKDREALQARYRSSYRNYIAVYYKLMEERAKIQDALDDLGRGREGSVCSDRDVEMMDEEGLRELASQYAAWTRELEGIRNAYSAEAERMDIATS
ncbi:hypothetical protein BJV74DRAFT_883171 [Russula compacta]|nr:hypothetical protein BJV74DRAFT_883171 [Russula compacta]